jgi:DNA-binding NarL/FixJ family response regulator
MAYKILIVDDHLVVKTGVKIILQSEIEGLSISFGADFCDLLQILSKENYDLIILDINIPGGKNTEMITEIKAMMPEVKVLMFSAYEEESHALRYIQAGANGYLNKLSGEDKIVAAVNSIMNHGEYIPDDIRSLLQAKKLNNEPINPFDKLSNRELEIAKLLIKGNGNLEISNSLNIQMSTVSTYKNRIFEKLKINNLVELIEMYQLYLS